MVTMVCLKNNIIESERIQTPNLPMLKNYINFSEKANSTLKNSGDTCN